MSREEILSIEQYCSAHNVTHKQHLAELNIPFWKFYRAKQRYRVCSMLFSPELLSRFIGIHTVPRTTCCFMENWSRSFTRKSKLEMALNRSRTSQLGVTSMQRHTLSGTLPQAITAALSQLEPGTRSKFWDIPSSMKSRIESTAKMGTSRCAFWGGREDCEWNERLRVLQTVSIHRRMYPDGHRLSGYIRF